MQRVSQATDLKSEKVKCSNLEHEGTLHIHLTDRPVRREKSPNLYTNISCAEDGSIVEVVQLDFGTLRKLDQQLVKAADQ